MKNSKSKFFSLFQLPFVLMRRVLQISYKKIMTIIKPLIFWFIFATQLESENEKLTSDILKKREKLAETEAQLVEATKDLREARIFSLSLFVFAFLASMKVKKMKIRNHLI